MSKNLSFREVGSEYFSEENPITILSQLARVIFDDTEFLIENFPLAYFNKKLMFSLEELQKFTETHEDLFETLKEKEEKTLEDLFKKTPVVLLMNKNTENLKF